MQSLPSRKSDSAETDEAGYSIAMEGMTAEGLGEAVRAILKGALKHAFFPSPAELRMIYDREMAVHWQREARERRFRDTDFDHDFRPATAEEKARSKQIYEEFKKVMAEAKLQEMPTEFDWNRVHQRFDERS